jgi:hypothetical protein
MNRAAAVSMSPFAAALLAGPMRDGTVLGHGHLLFGDSVVTVTRPGKPRMPNGIEAELRLVEGERVTIGVGELRAGDQVVLRGPLWNPRPLHAPPPVREPTEMAVEELAGHGRGLTPLGDDILIGYIGGGALAGRDMMREAELAARRTTALSATLLRLAARGELPEPAHRLVEDGDPHPLHFFGSSSGRGIELGLALAGFGGAQPCS